MIFLGGRPTTNFETDLDPGFMIKFSFLFQNREIGHFSIFPNVGGGLNSMSALYYQYCAILPVLHDSGFTNTHFI